MVSSGRSLKVRSRTTAFSCANFPTTRQEWGLPPRKVPVKGLMSSTLASPPTSSSASSPSAQPPRSPRTPDSCGGSSRPRSFPQRSAVPGSLPAARTRPPSLHPISGASRVLWAPSTFQLVPPPPRGRFNSACIAAFPTPIVPLATQTNRKLLRRDFHSQDTVTFHGALGRLRSTR